MPVSERDIDVDIRGIANMGFTLALDYGLRGPAVFRSTFPKEWQEEYEKQNYYRSDPILLTAGLMAGAWRWSDVLFSNRSKVMARAQKHGLRFGAIACSRSRKGLSFLSVARSDRELRDDEISRLRRTFESIHGFGRGENVLSERALRTVENLSKGAMLKEIAEWEEVSEAAIKSRLAAARNIMGAKTNAALVAKCKDAGYF